MQRGSTGQKAGTSLVFTASGTSSSLTCNPILLAIFSSERKEDKCLPLSSRAVPVPVCPNRNPKNNRRGSLPDPASENFISLLLNLF
ncbi:MAG: hypothetical protein IMW93_08490 [Thermoanaerobacteraceae bacterium]|nr:hypothetical protein [Thermoanaerobacteraceae bacterium]